MRNEKKDPPIIFHKYYVWNKLFWKKVTIKIDELINSFALFLDKFSGDVFER